jgi:hypothetical protein
MESAVQLKGLLDFKSETQGWDGRCLEMMEDDLAEQMDGA